MPENQSAISYLCPNCAAGLVFDADKQKFACEFCLSEFDEEELKSSGQDTAAEEKQRMDEDFSASMNEYVCQNCGATIAVDEHTTADFCYFCHNPVVLKGKMTGSFKPDKIISFKYGKSEAKKKFLEFAKKKWFVPKDFFSEEHAEQITGVYYPFWITDADTDTTAHGHATRVRVYVSGNWEYTETSKFDIHRSGHIHFEDITTSAFSKAEKQMLEGILPFPADNDVHLDFNMAYLSGYQAKMRDIERDTLSDEVKGRMKKYSETILGSTVNGYNTFSWKDLNMKIQNSHWEYTLLPVWVLTYTSKSGKLYKYAMNGHTGKVYGELPLSWGKLLGLGGAILALGTLIFTLIGELF